MLRSALLAALLLASSVQAQSPSVPASSGLVLRLSLGADGVQIYRCAQEAAGPRWLFQGPEAWLFDATGRQQGTHGAGPHWRLADGSMLRAEVVRQAVASQPHAIPWLLLRVVAQEGQGRLTGVSEIRRIDTYNGPAPTAGCDIDDVGQEARMRYSAVYEFYAPP